MISFIVVLVFFSFVRQQDIMCWLFKDRSCCYATNDQPDATIQEWTCMHK